MLHIVLSLSLAFFGTYLNKLTKQNQERERTESFEGKRSPYRKDSLFVRLTVVKIL